MTLPPFDWREYLDARLEATLGVSLRDYVDTRIDSLEHARIIALDAMEHRLVSMNEFRSTLTDQAKTFINQNQHESLIKRITDLERNQSRAEGRQSVTSGAAVVAVLLSILAFIIDLFIKK